ncbi:MAG: hypothetical protein AAFV29_19010, partial [Myxococcota bacterium]
MLVSLAVGWVLVGGVSVETDHPATGRILLRLIDAGVTVVPKSAEAEVRVSFQLDAQGGRVRVEGPQTVETTFDAASAAVAELELGHRILLAVNKMRPKPHRGPEVVRIEVDAQLPAPIRARLAVALLKTGHRISATAPNVVCARRAKTGLLLRRGVGACPDFGGLSLHLDASLTG